ncbi:PEP/pyruvate-binding domain-containing protein [Endozoicomonas sp. ALB032]|uniref:PEP/pyruvate-binding domain-containing protein n=1 Tax=Endozoicomonas sp. ALB032 TaxID=3403082 RepID=UPI003BB7DCC2
MLPATRFDISNSQSLATVPNQNTEVNSSIERHFSDLDPSGVRDPTSLTRRTCRSPASDQAAGYSPSKREHLGGKGMFLLRMKEAGLSVPLFECVTTQVMHALEQHPLERHLLERYFPGFVYEPATETSLKKIREYLNTLLPSEQTKRDDWLAGLVQFIVSDDYYQQVKDSEAAQHIKGLRRQLDRSSKSQPFIVRSSGINEDNYGDAQAGKYLSEVQGDEDVLRTCLRVMASAYRPEVCSEGISSPMALVIQECIDCQYGGVAMSFQSFEDGTVRVEYTMGQPRGVVAGQSGNTPHRIDIYRGDSKEETYSFRFFPGTISSRYILRKNDNGYSETRMDDADAQSNDVEQQLTDDMVADLRQMVTELEKLLLCPVDMEFAIDHQGRLFLLQVRPVTRLSGGLDFAMPIPEETLATGEGVSEGYCTGPLWLAEEPAAGSMPEGAIVVARHAKDWMLEPGFLKRAGGFVTATGGFNDHVAILMKQQRKTLMLAGDQFESVAAQVGQQATLACARFNGKPGAFIVAGDMTGKLLSHGILSSAASDEPSAKAIPSWDDLSLSEGALRQVASGFQWLTDQNARLLAFFASGGGLDCLANPVKLSMSPQRSKRLAETCDSINRLVYGAKALLDGYKAFLQLAVERSSDRVESLRNELPQLSNRFERLKRTIQFGLERITLPMQAAEGEKVSPVTFRQWVADCHQLQSCLQALNLGKAEQVRSVHELIFALHQRFVEALAPVTLASGQGEVSTVDDIIFVDCTTPGAEAPLLRPSGKAYIEGLELSGTVVSMDDALIVNLKLGSHMSLVELLEHTEGGKGRTLRLKFSDRFRSPDGSGEHGKLKRMWFLVQLLKVINLGEKADSMKLGCNAVAGEIIVEYSGMKSRKAMQDAFEKLMIVLNGMAELDFFFRDRQTFAEDHWDFSLLAQSLNPEVMTEADRFTFQYCLFTMYYLRDFCRINPECCQLLSNHLQQFVYYAEQLGKCCALVYSEKKPEDSLREILMSVEISEDIRRELLHHFLLSERHYSIGLIEYFYPDLRGQYFIIKPSRDYTLTFDVPPSQSLLDIKGTLKEALVKGGLEYVSQGIRSDKELVLEALAGHPSDVKYAGKELRGDKQVAIAAVTRRGCLLFDVNSKLQDDDDVIKAAIKQNPGALEFASERIRRDKSIINSVIKHGVFYLQDASETLLNDREYMLDLIAEYPEAFQYVASGLKSDQNFIDSVILRNPKVDKYVRYFLNNV